MDTVFSYLKLHSFRLESTCVLKGSGRGSKKVEINHSKKEINNRCSKVVEKARFRSPRKARSGPRGYRAVHQRTGSRGGGGGTRSRNCRPFADHYRTYDREIRRSRRKRSLIAGGVRLGACLLLLLVVDLARLLPFFLSLSLSRFPSIHLPLYHRTIVG